MHREVITKPDSNDEKEVQNRSGFNTRDFIATSKHVERTNIVENNRQIFAESCELFRSEESPTSDVPQEGHRQLEDEMQCDEKKITECETEALKKPADDTERLYDVDNSENKTDDEETVLLNGITKIFVTCEASCLKNERAKISSENGSSKEPRDKQEEKPKRKLKKKRALAIADALFVVAVVAPLVVSYWRGLWTLMDVHQEIFLAHRCFFLGIGVHTTFGILKHHLHANFAKELKSKTISASLGYRLVRTSYTYIFSTGCIMHWRGAWIIFDDYTLSYEWFLRYATVTCVVLLILLRSVRNLLAPPYIIGIDKRGYVFYFPTRFDVNTRDWALYILDCAFSVGVVGTLVVFVWRGVWVTFDLYLFPDNAEYSAVGSVIIGYTIVVITFSLQPLMRYACTRLKGFPRLAAVDIFLLVSFAGTVNVWRGVWNVLGLWLLPDDPEMSCWITHLGCFTFLVLLNCSNSILVRGVYIDAEEAEGKCAVFPCHYLRLFFKIEREKKEARRQNLVVASRDLATITERAEKEENGALMTSNSSSVTENPESLV